MKINLRIFYLFFFGSDLQMNYDVRAYQVSCTDHLHLLGNAVTTKMEEELLTLHQKEERLTF